MFFLISPRTELGHLLTLPCSVKDLGPMVLLWKKGSRVLTAGAMKVRRDDRIVLQGTNLQIKDIGREDSGEYICELETDDDEPIAIVHSVEILGKTNFCWLTDWARNKHLRFPI